MVVLGWFGKYWSWLLFAVFGVFLFLALHDSSLMNQRAKYTIGYLTGWHPTAKSGIYYNFRFSAADSVYEGSSQSDPGMNTATGARFVVKYDSVNPATNVGFFALPIPDSIRRPPRTGWRIPPFPIPRQILERDKKNN